MEVRATAIPGPLVIEPRVFADDRGWFCESWSEAAFAAAGIAGPFVQDNHSRSRKGVLRGLHYQQPCAQGKLVRVSAGRVFDVAVDLRRSSDTFGRWIGVELSGENLRQLWIPPGFAHGFLALEDGTDVLYKCTALYSPGDEHTLRWDDPDFAIDWPLDRVDAVLLSDRDRAGKPLAQAVLFA